jgi:hypothetical protein
MIEEILKKFQIKFDDLNAAETETLKLWLESLSKNELSVAKIKDYIRSMLSAVEKELSENSDKNKDIYLKARMRNYLLLVDFLESPEKAKKMLENTLKNLK